MTPEPETLAAIYTDHNHRDWNGTYRCGCELRKVSNDSLKPYRWFLCPYHDGFDDVIATKVGT